jgi:hypothetical protein
MDSLSPKIRSLAERLVAVEAASGKGGQTPATSQVIEKLRRRLSTLAGLMGFYSLLSRALALAKQQDPGLDMLAAKPDGSIEGVGAELDHNAGGVILLSQLLGLLDTFIGGELTLRIIQDAWPDLDWNAFF